MTQTTVATGQQAIWLERLTFILEDMSWNPLGGHVFKTLKPLGYSLLYSGDPDVIMPHLTCTLEHILSGYSCEMHTAWHVTGRLNCPMPRQTILLYKCSTNSVLEGAMQRSLPRLRLQYSIRLASHLVRWPNSYSGGFEFESCVDMKRHFDIVEGLWGRLLYTVQNTSVKEISTVTMAYKQWCRPHSLTYGPLLHRSTPGLARKYI